jgi:hypothetical protein
MLTLNSSLSQGIRGGTALADASRLCGAMRRLNESTESYRVEVTPAAWSQIGSVPQDVFRRIQARLMVIAELAGVDQRLTHSIHSPMQVVVEDFVADYSVDPQTRAVTLWQVRRYPEAK